MIARATSNELDTIAAPANPRYRSLDLWRGVACLMVVVLHASFIGRDLSATGVSAKLMTIISRFGAGVVMFFVVSGYCIAATADSTRRKQRKGSGASANYFKRRLRRIFPPYWAALLLTAIVVIGVVAFGLPHLLQTTDGEMLFPTLRSLSPAQWFGNLTLTEAWRYHVAGGNIAQRSLLLGPAWTLCYEEQFYLVCGLLLLVARKRFFTGALIVSAIVIALLPLTLGRAFDHTRYFFFDGRWLSFAAGVLVYWAINYGSPRGRIASLATLTVALLAALVLRYIALRHADVYRKELAFEFVIAFSFAIALMLLHRFDRKLIDAPLLRPVALCGTMCYSLYLVHYPVTILVGHWLASMGVRGNTGVLLVTIPVGIIASIAVASIFYLLIERRFLNPPQAVRSTVVPPPRGAMTGENIICFAKDWNEVPTSNNHVMTELSKGNRVLWLNSLGTRTPNLASGRDIGKIFRKLASFARGTREVRTNLWVYTPVVLPFPHSRLARWCNKKILRVSLKLIRRKLGMREFQLWTFLPNTADYLGTLGESLSVYYCVDNWAKFSYVNAERTAQQEQALCKRADIVFATAQSLVNDRRPLNPRTTLARHGVDFDLFSRALDDDLQTPADLARIPGPILGFYGTIHDWVDLDLLHQLATCRPNWSIVLIGRERVDCSALRALPNVHFLGHREHSQLPSYCKGFSVGLIPQRINELTLHMNPIKLREYLCAGLPVVATALPEVMSYAPHCVAARDYAEFEAACEAAIRNDTPALRRARSELMRGETWQRKVNDIGETILRLKAERTLSKASS